METTRIAVFGAGSMGMVLGALLTRKGHDVTLIDAYQPHVNAMNQNGAHIVGTMDAVIPVKAITPQQMTGIYDLIFLVCKQTANSEALQQMLPYLGKESVVCTLQNGVPELSVAQAVGKDRTIGGIMMWAATGKELGVSELTSDLSNKAYPIFEIGEIDGRVTDRVEKVAEILRSMGPTVVTSNLMGSRWFKVMINSTISGMSTALGITFYEALHDPRYKTYSFHIARECGRVCRAAGCHMPDFHGKDPVDLCCFEDQAGMEACENMLTSVIPSTDRTGIASMLQDLKKGRKRTEIDMINGFVAAQGDIVGIETPLNDAIVAIVKDIEQGVCTYCPDNLKRFPSIN